MADSGKTSLGQPMLPPMYEFRPSRHGGDPCMWVHIEDWSSDLQFPALQFPHVQFGVDEDPDGLEAMLWLMRGNEFHPIAKRVQGRVELVPDAPIQADLHTDLGAVIVEENPGLQSGDAFWMLVGHELPTGWGTLAKK